MADNRPGQTGHVNAHGNERLQWKKKFGTLNAKSSDEAEEIRRLKKELARVTEERDILKKTAAYFARDAK